MLRMSETIYKQNSFTQSLRYAYNSKVLCVYVCWVQQNLQQTEQTYYSLKNSRKFLQAMTYKQTKDKLFKCPVEGCLKAFNEKGILKTHLRIHTGDKPYKCSYPSCQYSYTTKSILVEHQIKIHSGLPPYTSKAS